MVKKSTGVIEPIIDGNKKWYQSKTKLGAIIGGASVILLTISEFLAGNGTILNMIPGLLAGIGVILAGLGIRNKLDEISFK